MVQQPYAPGESGTPDIMCGFSVRYAVDLLVLHIDSYHGILPRESAKSEHVDFDICMHPWIILKWDVSTVCSITDS